MIFLILSDLHLGRGRFLKNGQNNILEDFHEDERFQEFLDYYSSGKHYNAEVHLILNGDILNLIQIDIDGVFDHILDEDLTVRQLRIIAQAHAPFFHAIKNFAQVPGKKVTYIIGNHDAGMAFTRAQEEFKKLTSDKVDIAFEREYHGIHFEHGHRFEVINTVPPQRYFIQGPHGKPILNLPWGSLFCISLLPILRKERPHIDKIRPMSAYIKWCFFHDFIFFWRMGFLLLRYFIQTNFDAFTKENRNFKTSIRVLKQVTIYPKFEKKARAILKKSKSIHTVVMGHTHLVEWRKFPEGKYYFNSGTWNPIPSVDASMHESSTNLTYIHLQVDRKQGKLLSGSVHVWQGKWRPFREEVSAVVG